MTYALSTIMYLKIVTTIFIMRSWKLRRKLKILVKPLFGPSNKKFMIENLLLSCLIKEMPFTFIIGDSRNYVPPLLGLSPTKRIATQILVIENLNGKKDFESFCL